MKNKPIWKGIKININDNRLIIHLRDEGGPYYKTYFHKRTDVKFKSREELLAYLDNFLEKYI